MEDSNNTSGSETWKPIPYHIKRESKILKFIDINEVEEETSYLIRFEESERSKDSNYKLELPLTYFRIPEKTIMEYQNYLDVKAFFKRNKDLKNYFEEIEDIRVVINEIEDFLVNIKDKEDFSEKIEIIEKLLGRIQEIEKTPRYQELVKQYGLIKRPIKNLNAILLENKSEILFEKIIWHFIFEKIFNLSDSNFKNTKAFIEKGINNKERETKLKKIKISEEVKEEISKVKIREHIEKSGNFEDIIRYPFSKKEVYFNHNTSFKWLWFLFGILSPYYVLFFIFIFINPIVEEKNIWIIFLILSLSPLIIIEPLKRVTNARNKMMKRGKLKEKFEEKITSFLIKPVGDEKEPEDNIKRKLFLDSLSEILHNEIYKFVFRDLDKCIRDYKSFNPVSMEIFLDGNQIFPLGTSYEGFFHKTSIPIHSDSTINKDEFSLKIITKKTIRKNKKNSRMINNRQFLSRKLRKLRVIIQVSLIAFIISLIFIKISILQIIIFAIAYLGFLINSICFFRNKYIYFSSLMIETNKEFINDMLSIANLFNKNKNIYPVTIDLREDCSYYFLAYAPRFHRIRFAKEMKDILRGLYTKLPTDLSSDIISFNIPRRKKLKKTIEFDIDLEIPIAGRIWYWIIGIFSMLLLMIISGIIYIISIINPLIFVNSFDLSTLRFVLTFLTLLIGFFGREILSDPTKDLHKIGIILIVISVLTGIIFTAPIFITLFY